MLGDRDVAIALDRVDGDIARGQRLRVHIAASAGTEENYMPQVRAARHDLGGQFGMIVEYKLIAAQQFGQARRVWIGIDIYRDLWVTGLAHAIEAGGHRLGRVKKQPSHGFAP